jgi:hypothetical protein
LISSVMSVLKSSKPERKPMMDMMKGANRFLY